MKSSDPFYRRYDHDLQEFELYYKGDLLGYINPDNGEFQWHDRELFPLVMSPELIAQFVEALNIP